MYIFVAGVNYQCQCSLFKQFTTEMGNTNPELPIYKRKSHRVEIDKTYSSMTFHGCKDTICFETGCQLVMLLPHFFCNLQQYLWW